MDKEKENKRTDFILTLNKMQSVLNTQPETIDEATRRVEAATKFVDDVTKYYLETVIDCEMQQATVGFRADRLDTSRTDLTNADTRNRAIASDVHNEEVERFHTSTNLFYVNKDRALVAKQLLEAAENLLARAVNKQKELAPKQSTTEKSKSDYNADLEQPSNIK